MSRKKIVVGNWKMNLMAADATERLTEFVGLLGGSDSVEVGICPTFLSLSAAVDATKGSTVGIGAQDMFWNESGAFTGFLSASMIENAGAKYVLIGHSERRGRFGKLEVPESTLGFFAETDETVNLKLRAALRSSLTPIVCIGETLAEREAGDTDSVIAKQMAGAIAGVEDLRRVVFAYEPVWAIGTGKVCDATEANRVCGFVRSCLPSEVRDSVRIQYGGSVNPTNAAELFSQPEIDGGLVGGASLKPTDFIQVVRAAG
jgi:triosephosphate isomerase (TIM)